MLRSCGTAQFGPAGDRRKPAREIIDAGREQPDRVQSPRIAFHADVGSRRYDGLIAAAPQNDAGRITEPPVCVPSASGIMPAPTAAAEPDDDPPGVWAWLCGLSVAVGSFEANAVVVVLPMMVAPAAFSSSRPARPRAAASRDRSASPSRSENPRCR